MRLATLRRQLAEVRACCMRVYASVCVGTLVLGLENCARADGAELRGSKRAQLRSGEADWRSTALA